MPFIISYSDFSSIFHFLLSSTSILFFVFLVCYNYPHNITHKYSPTSSSGMLPAVISFHFYT